MFSLAGKKALVTGATGGIGGSASPSRWPLPAQRSRFLAASRKKLDAITAQIPGSVGIVCDLSKLDTVENLIKTAEEKLGGLDILICNAGVTRDNLALRMKDEEWQQVIDVNLTASFKLSRAAMKENMMKRRFGRIIYITSVVGASGNPGQANYCASKAGLTGMAKSLAQEMSSSSISVNCIAPGFITTDMTGALNDEQKAKINGNIPLGRMGTADEIAASAVFLSSDEAAYITGQTLRILMAVCSWPKKG